MRSHPCIQSTLLATGLLLTADHPGGLPARTELYDLPADPGEKNNLAESNPETVKELRAVMAAHAQHLPPPNRWNRKKWTELMESLQSQSQS